jgi:hypothetical protein
MNRRRTSWQILASHSARSVVQQPRRSRKPAPGWARWPAALKRLRRRLGRSLDRWAERTSERAASPEIRLIGLDVVSLPSRLKTGSWAPVVVAAVVGGLFLAVLRMDVIRLRFSLASAFEEELRLEELKRELTVDMRQLRDPAVLGRRAQEIGFQRAARLIELGQDMPLGGSPPRRDEPSQAIELAAASSGGLAGQRP